MKKWYRKINYVSRYDVIVHCVNDFEWQKFRLGTLKGLSTEQKLLHLVAWLNEHMNSFAATCQVDNYLGALKRGGQIDSEGNVLK